MRFAIICFIPYFGNSFFAPDAKITRHVTNIAVSRLEVGVTTTVTDEGPPLIQKAEQTVWNVFGELAMRTKSTNLGQGFPDWEPAPFVLKAMVDVMTMPSMVHQYTRPAGYPLLVKLLADRYSRHLNREVDDLNEVAVTVGASQALYLALTTLLSKGDEVVMFEPFFDLYIKQIALTGATTRFVQLGGAKASLADPWALDIEALRAQITPKTKVLILNSPHNPTGKVFSLEEMEAIREQYEELKKRLDE